MEKSYVQPLQTITVQASANLTSKNRFVKISSGKLAYCGANGKAIGVLSIAGDQNEYLPVATYGVVHVEVGSGGVTENTLVTSDANGKAIAVAALEAAIATGAVAMKGDAENATVALTGGVLPVAINGIALDTGSEGATVRVKLL